MRHKSIFTKTEFAIILICVLILLANLGAVGDAGRERAKRSVCLVNLKQLTTAWNLYADDNEDRLINGEAYVDFTGPPAAPVPASGNHKGEQWWVGNDCAQDYQHGEQRPQDIQIAAIRAGALFNYCKTEKIYRCPTGIRGQMRTYSIVDSMNGRPRTGTINANGTSVKVGDTVLWVKKKSEITVPGPAYRLVFIDEGWAVPDSYAVYYNHPQWWDPPPVQHNDGATLSFADGHSDYWKWGGIETIKKGKETNPPHNWAPTTTDGIEDLQRMQIAVWGRLGY